LTQKTRQTKFEVRQHQRFDSFKLVPGDSASDVIKREKVAGTSGFK